MILNRPCGACGELVPAATGCKHWQPGQRMLRGGRPEARARREAREAAAKALAEAQP